MADIFLSYNREDQATADEFVRGFEDAGLSVWWDRRLRAGEAYDEVTENALREARAVVVLWSQRAVASRWVRAEATLAQRIGTFVPCMIEPCERPIMFELTQTEDLSQWTGDYDAPAWKSFGAHVRTMVDAHGDGGAVAPTAPRTAQHRPPSRVSERRQITFVSAALNDGDLLSSRTDPEDWHDFLSDLQKACQPAIERYSGKADWTGHRFTVTFGYPVALEDAGQRAILTAREALLAAARVRLPAGAAADDTQSKLKIGIHTGDMLVTARGDGFDLVGEGQAVSEAARDAAEAGQILVTEAVKTIASNKEVIVETDQASHGQKLFLVGGTASEPQDGNAWTTGKQTGFVGREDDLALMRGRWKRTLENEGQFIFIRGEPGIGKSRLVEHFRTEVASADPAWFMLQGSSLFPNTPYFPLAQSIQQAIEQDTERPLDALAQLVERNGFAPELVNLLAPAIGIEAGDGEGSSTAPDANLSQLPAQLAGAILDLTDKRPVVLCLDDLQWFDPSTLEMVQLLVEQGDGERLLILGTARPEFSPPWSEREHHSRIILSRLSKAEIKDLISEAAGDEELDPETLQSILDKASGVPLFAEELAKLATRHDTGEGSKLPPTLRSLLAARMDRLGPARELLQVCSVLETCSFALLEEMTDLSTEDLQSQLRFLGEEQLLQVRGAPPHSTYRFKHALLRDGAYETLTRKHRRDLHDEAARKITEEFPEIAEREKELIATHWTKAGNVERAVAAWLQAGQRDFVRGASREAAAHLRKGLALAGDLPEGAEHDRLEMELWSALNNALQQALGYSNPETIEAADRATSLAKKLGLLGNVIVGEAQLWRGLVTDGQYDEADAVADRINALNEDLEDTEQLEWMPFFAANALIQTAYYNGRLREFEEPFARLSEHFGRYEGMVSVNDDVVAIGVASLAAWASGRSPLARERIARAIEVAEGSGQPYAIAVAYHFGGTLMAFDRDMDSARAYTERALKVCDDNGIEFIGHLVRAKIGWLSNDVAPSTENIMAMRAILDAMVALNGRVGLVINMNRLAMAYAARGELEEAYKTACEALEANPQERIVRPETFQIKARLENTMGQKDAAETDFRQAIALADEIGAMAYQLSATVELAQFLIKEERDREALEVLDQTLACCGPEIDTPSLTDAKALRFEIEAEALQRLDSSRV